jgi:hypothetical protein
MSHESDMVMPRPPLHEKEIIMPVLEAMPRPPLDHSQQENDARVVEALFAAKERESAAVAGLLSLWTGTMLLNDLAAETFSEPADEFEPVRKKPKEEEEQ